MKKKLPILFAVILCVTFVSHILFYYFGTAVNLADGIKFNDYDSFIAYMEQKVPAVYYDKDGNLIESLPSNEPAMQVIIDDGTSDGKVVCEYIYRNASVAAVLPDKSNDGLPINVISQNAYRAALRTRNTINWIFIALYPLELIVALLTARKVRAHKTA